METQDWVGRVTSITGGDTGLGFGVPHLKADEKIFRGMLENGGLIFTHPKFADDFLEICGTSLAALPDDQPLVNDWRESD